MSKDVIYIDVEDDITAIIGKVKASKDKIVALVPPKRIGVLQSAVNLRLLARQAENSKKHLVIVTNNPALIALSSMAKIPVAKNLQSEPEIAEIAALDIDDGEDVIDGAQLPVGELQKTTPLVIKRDDVSEAIESIDVENEIPTVAVHDFKTPKSSDRGNKVPDFSRFRKRLFAFILIAPFVVGFLVWATIYAPSARVIITTKTSLAPVSLALKLGGTTATDISKNIIQTISKQSDADVSVDFTATGQKDLGAKASGTMTVRNCDYPSGFTLPAGTKFTADGGQVFVSSAAVSVPSFSGLSSACTLAGSASGKATVGVQALASGESYNVVAGLYTIETIPTSAKVDALGTVMSGGTTRMATIVTADDIQKASQALVALPTDTVKQQLVEQFVNGESVISDSFTVNRAAAVSVPALGEEAVGGKVKLTSKASYSITAIAKSEVQAFLKDAIAKQITNVRNQRIYDDGVSKVVLSGYFNNDQGATINIATVGQIGPNIDQTLVKQLVKDKRYGEAQSTLESITGVSDVDVKFSYFWVNTVPSDDNKIQVEFVSTNA